MRITTGGEERLSTRWMRTGRRLIMCAVLVLGWNNAQAQDETTFTVTVEQKTSEHPNFGNGDPDGYAIDGEQGAELTLIRGTTYTFEMDDVPAIHPFYISTSEVGAGAGEYSEGVTGNGATDNETLTFTPSESTPDELYYQCSAHQYMGWIINVTDTATDREDVAAIPDAFVLHGNYPNPFNPSTSVRFDLAEPAEVHVEVFNLLGQRILQVPAQSFAAGSGHSISLEAGRLPSGMYLYQVLATTTSSEWSEHGLMTLAK